MRCGVLHRYFILLHPCARRCRIADALNHAVRYVQPNGTIITVAGNGSKVGARLA